MPYTVGQIVEKIQTSLPPVDPNRTADVLHAGDPAALVTGVAVTFQATCDVCAEAVRRGANLIITHEPTFYVDGPTSVLDVDPVFEAKRRFIEARKLNIWRCHDAWHRRQPDGILTGMITALGWLGHQSPGDPRVLDLPAPMTLRELVIHAKEKLGIASIRFVGDGQMPVRRIAYSAGAPGWSTHRTLLRHQGVDALLIGETREWETNEYVRDWTSLAPPDQQQGLIVLGHANSEEAGMKFLADWLRPMIPGVDVTFLPAGDPFQHA